MTILQQWPLYLEVFTKIAKPIYGELADIRKLVGTAEKYLDLVDLDTLARVATIVNKYSSTMLLNIPKNLGETSLGEHGRSINR